MSFRPLSDHPRVVSHEAYVSSAASPTNQFVTSTIGDSTIFERGVNYALVKLAASAPVQLQVPDSSEPPGWTTRITLADFDSDHAPLMFVDGIRIVSGGATVNAYVVAIR